jgi:hypothetical protein
MIITLEMLRQKHACRDQVARFQELFGAKVAVTVELAVKHAQDFNWDWAAWSLLSAAGYSAYIAAMAEALLAYAAATDEARLAYAAATDEARLAYAAALAESPRAYNAACARAFAEAAIGDTP